MIERRIDLSGWLTIPQDMRQTPQTVPESLEQLEIPGHNWWQGARLDLVAIEGVKAALQRTGTLPEERSLERHPYQSRLDISNTLPE